MLPGIIYQKATGSQILDSEAQTKTVTKNQMGKWAQASRFLANALSHHALLVLGSGIQRMRNTRLPCCTLSFQKPQQKSHWPFPWAPWGAGLLLTTGCRVQIFQRYYPPCMHADPHTCGFTSSWCLPQRDTSICQGAQPGEWYMSLI